jgi:hypothetical protein
MVFRLKMHSSALQMKKALAYEQFKIYGEKTDQDERDRTN